MCCSLMCSPLALFSDVFPPWHYSLMCSPLASFSDVSPFPSRVVRPLCLVMAQLDVHIFGAPTPLLVSLPSFPLHVTSCSLTVPPGPRLLPQFPPSLETPS